MRRRLATVSLIGMAGLIACSSVGNEVIFNATQQELVVRLEPASIFGRRFLQIEAGEHRRFSRADKLDGYIVFSTRNCIYYYDPPPVERDYWSQGPGGSDVNMQIEPDMLVYLLPSGAKAIMAKRELLKVQKYGYPNPAVARICR